MPLDGLRVQWRESFSVGDDLIDAQHRQFFAEIRRIAAAIEGGAGRDAVAAFFRAFVTGLERHFRDEEDLLARVRFPDLDNHKVEHQALLSAVKAVEDLVVASRSMEELHFIVKRLFSALVEHLVSEDMRYKSHVLAAKGL